MKKKNPGTFIPIRIVGSKVQMRVPNRNPGTLKQASAIAKKLGIRKNPDRRYEILAENPDTGKDKIVIKTASSASEAKKLFLREAKYIWPHAKKVVIYSITQL